MDINIMPDWVAYKLDHQEAACGYKQKLKKKNAHECNIVDIEFHGNSTWDLIGDVTLVLQRTEAPIALKGWSSVCFDS